MTDTLELIELSLNLDDAIPCTMNDCGKEAHYRGVCRACRADAGGRLCEAHYQQWMQTRMFEDILIAFGSPVLIAVCNSCGAEGPITYLVEIVPL
jgi:hypothetical protein